MRSNQAFEGEQAFGLVLARLIWMQYSAKEMEKSCDSLNRELKNLKEVETGEEASKRKSIYTLKT